MINQAEKIALVQRLMNPIEATRAVWDALHFWCEEYPSVRQGLLAIVSEAKRRGWEVKYATLRKIYDSPEEGLRIPSLETAMIVISVLLHAYKEVDRATQAPGV